MASNAPKLRGSWFYGKSLQQCLSIFPIELLTDILSYTVGYEVPSFPTSLAQLVDMMSSAKPLPVEKYSEPKPPANGSSPFLSMPFDARRLIFDYVLPDSKIIATPHSSKASKRTKAGIDTVNLLVVNKQINEEVCHMLYQETVFRLRVSPEGIQLMHHPIMPLDINGYYMGVKGAGDVFNRPNSLTGFNNMRHLDIALWGADRTADWKAETLALRALVQYLVDIRGKAPLYTLRITLLDSIEKPGNFWWNPETNTPRMSPFHDMSMIEVVTQPLEKLRKLYVVDIDYSKAIPPAHHDNIIMQTWQRRLTSLLRSKKPYVAAPKSTIKVQQINDALINWRYKQRFGGTLNDGADVSEEIHAESSTAMDNAPNPVSGKKEWNPVMPPPAPVAAPVAAQLAAQLAAPAAPAAPSAPAASFLPRMHSADDLIHKRKREESEFATADELTKTQKRSHSASPHIPDRPESEFCTAEESIMDLDLPFQRGGRDVGLDGIMPPSGSPTHPPAGYQFSQPLDPELIDDTKFSAATVDTVDAPQDPILEQAAQYLMWATGGSSEDQDGDGDDEATQHALFESLQDDNEQSTDYEQAYIASLGNELLGDESIVGPPAAATDNGVEPAYELPGDGFPEGVFQEGTFPEGTPLEGAFPEGTFPAGGLPGNGLPGAGFPEGGELLDCGLLLGGGENMRWEDFIEDNGGQELGFGEG